MFVIEKRSPKVLNRPPILKIVKIVPLVVKIAPVEEPWSRVKT